MTSVNNKRNLIEKCVDVLIVGLNTMV